MKKVLIIAFVFLLLGSSVFAQPNTVQIQTSKTLKEQENRKSNKILRIKEINFESVIDNSLQFMEQIYSINNIDSIERILDTLHLENKAYIRQITSIYDKNGCFIERESIYENKECVNSNIIFKYDKTGQLLEKNTDFQKISYIYEDNYLNKIIYHYKYDSTISYNNFIYDSLGRIETEIRTDTIDYLYNSKGEIVKAIRKDIYNHLRTSEYVYDNGEIIEENIFNDGKLYINKIFKYDKHNNLITIIEYHPSKHQFDVYYIIWNYIYDDSGRTIAKSISRGRTEDEYKLNSKVFIKYNNEDNEILNISVGWSLEDMEPPMLHITKKYKLYEYY